MSIVRDALRDAAKSAETTACTGPDREQVCVARRLHERMSRPCVGRGHDQQLVAEPRLQLTARAKRELCRWRSVQPDPHRT